MKRTLIPGTVYVVLLFAIGFVLGACRVMFVVPVIGQLWATVAEIPIMLMAAFFLCRWVMLRWNVPTDVSHRLQVAIWFLALLLLFETTVAALLFGRSFVDQWAALLEPAGLVGLSGQLAAAVLPLMVGRRSQI
jgi:hypothetical protein